MVTRKIPMRMCAVTREKHPKNEMIRVVRTPEGLVKVDKTSKLNGRGVYLKKDPQVISIAQKKNVLGRILAIDIPDEVYQQLLNN